MTEIDDIVATTEAHLRSRPSRSIDHEGENEALMILAREMADHPERVLDTLCIQVMNVCGAESAGVSLLNDPVNDTEFFWPAIAGKWSVYVGGGMPHAASPCGVVLDRNAPLIFHNVEQQFPAAEAALPRIEEILLAPFRKNGVAIGTVWAVSHSKDKRFEREDLRLLENLANFAGAAYQMTEAGRTAKDAREQLRLVNHELGHRLKNMLTMVMAVASQTLKGVTEQDAVDAFQNRLQALGTAHDVLLDQTWVAAPVSIVAERVVRLVDGAGRTSFSGPNVTLGPRAALSLSLMLHELATNAIKYGAFSTNEGRATFSWEVTADEDPLLRARWKETGGPPVTTPSRKGFGSRLIAMGLIGRGGVTLSYDTDGVTADFEAPLRLAIEPDAGENASDH